MVSIRVNKQGKRIPSDFDWIMAQETMDQLMGKQENLHVNLTIQEVKSYHFGSRGALRALMLSKGYRTREKGGNLELMRNGRVQASVALKEIDQWIHSNLLAEKITDFQEQSPKFQFALRLLKEFLSKDSKSNHFGNAPSCRVIERSDV